MIKRIMLIISLIPALAIISIALVAERLTYGVDLGEIRELSEYSEGFLKASSSSFSVSSEVGLMFVLYNIVDYSFWIITFSIIWIVIVLFILFSIRRSKVGEEKD